MYCWALVGEGRGRTLASFKVGGGGAGSPCLLALIHFLVAMVPLDFAVNFSIFDVDVRGACRGRSAMPKIVIEAVLAGGPSVMVARELFDALSACRAEGAICAMARGGVAVRL